MYTLWWYLSHTAVTLGKTPLHVSWTTIIHGVGLCRFHSHFLTNTYFHERGLCLSYQVAGSLRAGDSFLSVIEQLEHVQNTHAESWSPVEENVNIRRFFISSLTLVVSMNEHSERERFLRESLHARVFKADVRIIEVLKFIIF